jgi:hypothetical protein
MDRLLEILLLYGRLLRLPRRFRPATATGTLHPGRRACRGQGIVRKRLRRPHRLRGGLRRHLDLGSGPACSSEGIVLANETGKLSQRVAFAPRRTARCHAAIQIIGHEIPILVTISHRDDASPSG